MPDPTWACIPPDVLELALAVRYAVEDLQPIYGWPPSLAGACIVASVALARLCGDYGISVEVQHGECFGLPHCWVTCGDRLVDVTATQFGLPRVFCPNVDDPRYDEAVVIPWQTPQVPALEVLVELVVSAAHAYATPEG